VTTPEPQTSVGVVLFDGFELLDVFGPLEMYGVLPNRFTIQLVGPTAGTVASAQGPRSVADHAYADAPSCDVLLVPGGIGNRPLLEDRAFLDWLAAQAERAQLVTSVCTGSALLAAAGVLDGHRATTNKRAFTWVRELGTDVRWQPQARWVEDGNRWTSSGVAAGIDMTLAIIASLHGRDVAVGIADGTEYEWHTDASWDPFAAKNHLVG